MHHSKPQAVTLFSFNSLQTFCVFLLFLDRVFLAPTLTAADATRGVVLVAKTGAADGVEFDAAGGRDERLQGRTRGKGVVAADEPEFEVRVDAAEADPREGGRDTSDAPRAFRASALGGAHRRRRRWRLRYAAGRARVGRGRPGGGAASRRCAASSAKVPRPKFPAKCSRQYAGVDTDVRGFELCDEATLIGHGRSLAPTEVKGYRRKEWDSASVGLG
ncbi:hypothetical protein B0H17DRAFT_1104725 [Mycena rosella]|uniref:Uncharacterized protein n=1 Tax=Mycena rosella TaxID=1033263 RepID=A0AAD7C9U9_MYCRO|nr:hypothetical protein B0H17DRAFT_1104725 [Mycena rosella]